MLLINIIGVLAWIWLLEEAAVMLTKKFVPPIKRTLEEQQPFVPNIDAFQFAHSLVGNSKRPPDIVMGDTPKYELFKNKVTLSNHNSSMVALWDAAHEIMHFRQRMFIPLSAIGFIVAALSPLLASILCLHGYPYWRMVAFTQLFGVVLMAIPDVLASFGASTCLMKYFELDIQKRQWLSRYTRCMVVYSIYGFLKLIIYAIGAVVVALLICLPLPKMISFLLLKKG